MAAVNHAGNGHGTGSRANSLEPVLRPAADTKQELHKDLRDEEDAALGVLTVAEQRRQRSIRYEASFKFFFFFRNNTFFVLVLS